MSADFVIMSVYYLLMSTVLAVVMHKHVAAGDRITHSVDLRHNIGGTEQVIQRTLLIAGKLVGLGLGLGSTPAEAHQFVTAQESGIDDEIDKPLTGLEQGIVGGVLEQDGSGHHGLFLIVGRRPECAGYDAIHTGGHAGLLVTGQVPRSVVQRLHSGSLAGTGLHAAGAGKEHGADALDFLAIDSVLRIPDLGGAVAHGLLQRTFRGVLGVAVPHGAKRHLVQTVLVLNSGALGGRMLHGPQPHNVFLSIQGLAPAGRLQAETELLIAPTLATPILGGAHSDVGDVRIAGHNVFDGPVIGGAHGSRSILRDTPADSIDITDSRGHTESLVDHFDGLVVGVNHAGTNFLGRSQSTVVHDIVRGQGHQHSEAAAGLGLLGDDIGSDCAVLRLLTVDGKSELRSIVHHIASDIAAYTDLPVQTVNVHTTCDTLTGNGGLLRSSRSVVLHTAQIDGVYLSSLILTNDLGHRLCHYNISPFRTNDTIPSLVGDLEGSIIVRYGY